MNYLYEPYWYLFTTIAFLYCAFTCVLMVAMIIEFTKENKSFHKECSTIEALMRNGETQSIVINRILQLSGGKFHKHMNYRVRELAKMAEMKYNITLLNK